MSRFVCLPESQMLNFEKELSRHQWDELFLNKSVDQQVELFPDILRTLLLKYPPWINYG